MMLPAPELVTEALSAIPSAVIVILPVPEAIVPGKAAYDVNVPVPVFIEIAPFEVAVLRL